MQQTPTLRTRTVTRIRKADTALDMFGVLMGISPTQPVTPQSPSLSCLLSPNSFPQDLLITYQHMYQMCNCCSMLLFKPSSKRKAEWGERNIWLHSTGDQFHKIWQLNSSEKGSLAGLAKKDCWRNTKQHNPNELENPWPSRGLSRCYRHKQLLFYWIQTPLYFNKGQNVLFNH